MTTRSERTGIKHISDELVERAIDRLVKEGKVERIIINGKPGVRLKEKKNEISN